MECEHHGNFGSHVQVARITNGDGQVGAFMAEVRMKCLDCDQDFVFVGLPIGLSYDGATVSAYGLELRAAIVPHLDWLAPAVLEPRGYIAIKVDLEPDVTGVRSVLKAMRPEGTSH